MPPTRRRAHPPHALVVALVTACAGSGDDGASTATSAASASSTDASTTAPSTHAPETTASTGPDTRGTTSASTGDTTGEPLPPELTVLASGYPRSRPLVLHGEHVYWGSAGASGGGQGAILRVPQAGGEVEVLLDGLDFPFDLALVDDALFWADFEGGLIGRIDLDTLATAIVADGYPAADIDGDADHVYWIAGDADPRLARAPLGGGAAADLVTGLTSPSALLVLDEVALILRGGTLNDLASVPKDGGPLTSLAAAGAVPRALTRDATHAYWVSSGDGAILRRPLAGGAADTLVQGTLAPFGLAVDDARLYWTSTLGSVHHAAKTGGAPELLVDGLMRPERIALGPAHVFFTDFDAGELLRVGKPP